MIKQKCIGSNNIQIGECNVIKGCTILGGTNIINGKVIVNGKELPKPPTDCHSTTIINDKVYIDGYELKNGKWKKTLRAWWHMWF